MFHLLTLGIFSTEAAFAVVDFVFSFSQIDFVWRFCAYPINKNDYDSAYDTFYTSSSCSLFFLTFVALFSLVLIFSVHCPVYFYIRFGHYPRYWRTVNLFHSLLSIVCRFFWKATNLFFYWFLDLNFIFLQFKRMSITYWCCSRVHSFYKISDIQIILFCLLFLAVLLSPN